MFLFMYRNCGLCMTCEIIFKIYFFWHWIPSLNNPEQTAKMIEFITDLMTFLYLKEVKKKYFISLMKMGANEWSELCTKLKKY